YGYDVVGDLATVTLPNGVVTTNTYDALNRLDLQTIDKGTGAGAVHIARYDYHVRADGLRDTVDETTFDAAGQNPATVHAAWSYDDLGRLVTEIKAAPGQPGYYADTYTYDLAGNRLTKVHDADGTADDLSTAYAYDTGGDDRLMTETATGTGAYQTTY